MIPFPVLLLLSVRLAGAEEPPPPPPPPPDPPIILEPAGPEGGVVISVPILKF